MTLMLCGLYLFLLRYYRSQKFTITPLSLPPLTLTEQGAA